MKADLSLGNLVVVETLKNELPMEFYRDKLIPAVKDGAVAVFSCYFWIDKLHERFNDPSYQVKFIENPHPLRKPTFLAPGFADTPNDMARSLRHTPSGVFEPAFPDQWTVLARQKLKDEKDMPFIIARPLGKGMVVLAGDIHAKIELLENLFELRKSAF